MSGRGLQGQSRSLVDQSFGGRAFESYSSRLSEAVDE
jgi:hypothetical protein